MTATARQFELLNLLKGPGTHSCRSLGQRLGVSKNTILRDLDRLSSAGVPISEDVVDRTTIFSLEGRGEAQRGLDPALVAPLVAVLAPWRATRWCKALAQRLGLEIPREFDAAAPQPLHPGGELAQRELLTGLIEHRQVRVKYRARHDVEGRQLTIEPLRLRTAAGLSYLDARVPPAAGHRTFALHRVISARATQQRFEPPRLPVRTAFGAVEGEAVDVVVRFDAPVAEFIAERRWHPSQQVEAAPDGSVLWRGRVSGEREFLGWVLGWAPWAEVLEPPEWRRSIGERAALLHSRHLPRIPEHPPPRVAT